MTTFGAPFDARQPRGPQGNSAPGIDAMPRVSQPGGLTAVCVIAIVLGALGLGGSLIGLGGLAAQPALQKIFTMQRQPGMPKGFVRAQADMQKKIEAVGLRYREVNMVLALINLVFAASLLAGGIMTMKMNPRARTFLVPTFAALIAFEIVRGVVTVFMQMDMVAVMSDSMSRMMLAAGPKGGPGASQFATYLAIFAKVIGFLGIAFTVGWGLAKMIFYGVGARYLCRPNVRRLFPHTPTDAP